MGRKKASLKGRGIDILLGEQAGAPAEEPAAQPGAMAAGPEALPPMPAEAAPAPASGAGPAATMPNPFVEPAPAPPVYASQPATDATAAIQNPFTEPTPVAVSAAAAVPNPFAEPPLAPVAAAAMAAAGESEMAPLPAEPALGESLPSLFAEPPPAPQAVEDSLSHEALGGQPTAPVSVSLPVEETPWLADEPPSIAEAVEPEAPSAAGAASIALPSDPTLFKPATYGGIGMSIEVMSGSGEYQPRTGITQTGMKAATLTEAKQEATFEEVQQRIGADRVTGLFKHVDALYAQVAAGAIANSERAEEALTRLRIARDKQLEDPRQFDEAEYLVYLVQYQVNHSTSIQQFRHWSSYFWEVLILVYGVFWLIVFGAGMAVSVLGLAAQWLTGFNLEPAAIATATSLFLNVMAGGLGGVLGLLYSLYSHVAIDRDFDHQFLLWYLVQPFLGMLMGVIVSLFLLAGVFLVDATGPAVQALGALLAIATAFRQNFVYAWLESLLRGFERRATAREATAEASKPESQPTTPAAVPAGEVQESPAGVG